MHLVSQQLPVHIFNASLTRTISFELLCQARNTALTISNFAAFFVSLPLRNLNDHVSIAVQCRIVVYSFRLLFLNPSAVKFQSLLYLLILRFFVELLRWQASSAPPSNCCWAIPYNAKMRFSRFHRAQVLRKASCRTCFLTNFTYQ